MSGSVSFTPLLQVTARTSFGEIVLLWFKHSSAFEVLFKAFENHAEHNADWTNELFLLLINALGVSVVGSVGQCWLAIHCCHVYHITRIINLESIVIETSTVVSTCYSFLFWFFFSLCEMLLSRFGTSLRPISLNLQHEIISCCPFWSSTPYLRMETPSFLDDRVHHCSQKYMTEQRTGSPCCTLAVWFRQGNCAWLGSGKHCGLA